MIDSATPRPNKNWLLIKFREWHSWGGLFLSGFIIVVAITGIMLNHKDLFFHGKEEDGPSGLLASTTDLSTIPVTFDAAMQKARDHFGDAPLEKIELKDERGDLIYKVVQGKGQEIIIDAHSGEMRSKYGVKLTPGQDGETKTASLNWAKIVEDLHTGKFLGAGGRLVVDLTSLTIIALTVTGIYLWGVPYLRKRKSQKHRKANGGMPASRRAVVTQAVSTEV